MIPPLGSYVLPGAMSNRGLFDDDPQGCSQIKNMRCFVWMKGFNFFLFSFVFYCRGFCPHSSPPCEHIIKVWHRFILQQMPCKLQVFLNDM